MFHDTPMFLVAALPFLAVAVLGLMACRHRDVQVALVLPAVILTAV